MKMLILQTHEDYDRAMVLQWFHKFGRERFHFCKTEQGAPSKMLLIGTSLVSRSDKQDSLLGIEQGREIRVKM